MRERDVDLERGVGSRGGDGGAPSTPQRHTSNPESGRGTRWIAIGSSGLAHEALPRAFETGEVRPRVHPELVLDQDVPRPGHREIVRRSPHPASSCVVPLELSGPSAERELGRSLHSSSHSQNVASTARFATRLLHPNRPRGSSTGRRAGARGEGDAAEARGQRSTARGSPAETNIPGASLSSRLASPKHSSVSGSSATGRPASYSAHTRPPHARTLVFARFFWCKSNALAEWPVPRGRPERPAEDDGAGGVLGAELARADETRDERARAAGVVELEPQDHAVAVEHVRVRLPAPLEKRGAVDGTRRPRSASGRTPRRDTTRSRSRRGPSGTRATSPRGCTRSTRASPDPTGGGSRGRSRRGDGPNPPSWRPRATTARHPRQRRWTHRDEATGPSRRIRAPRPAGCRGRTCAGARGGAERARRRSDGRGRHRESARKWRAATRPRGPEASGTPNQHFGRSGRPMTMDRAPDIGALLMTAVRSGFLGRKRRHVTRHQKSRGPSRPSLLRAWILRGDDLHRASRFLRRAPRLPARARPHRLPLLGRAAPFFDRRSKKAPSPLLVPEKRSRRPPSAMPSKLVNRKRVRKLKAGDVGPGPVVCGAAATSARRTTGR